MVDHSSSLQNKPSALQIQMRIIGALLLRELHARYGRENIGFLWVIVEPMILATVITALHFNPSTHYSSDIGPVPFMIVGYTVFIIFRNTFNRAEGAVEVNQSLLYHRNVTVFDIIIARAVMDVVGCLATLIVLLSVAIALGFASPPVRPLYIITAALLMSWWTLALTLIASSVSYRNELIGRQLHVMSYFSIPLSGAFYQLQWLPHAISDKLQWFPMPLIFEQARYGQFSAASDMYVDPAYVAAWCAGLTYLGLVLVRRVRSRVHG